MEAKHIPIVLLLVAAMIAAGFQAKSNGDQARHESGAPATEIANPQYPMGGGYER